MAAKNESEERTSKLNNSIVFRNVAYENDVWQYHLPHKTKRARPTTGPALFLFSCDYYSTQKNARNATQATQKAAGSFWPFLCANVPTIENYSQ